MSQQQQKNSPVEKRMISFLNNFKNYSERLSGKNKSYIGFISNM